MKLAEQLRAERLERIPFYKNEFLEEVKKCFRTMGDRFGIAKDDELTKNTIPFMQPRVDIIYYPEIRVHACHFYDYLKLLQDNGFYIYQRGSYSDYLFVGIDDVETFEHCGICRRITF